jgi:hypothetical protein
MLPAMKRINKYMWLIFYLFCKIFMPFYVPILIPVGAGTFFAPAQTGPQYHPASNTMVTGSLS